jgi:hypothetical protein
MEPFQDKTTLLLGTNTKSTKLGATQNDQINPITRRNLSRNKQLWPSPTILPGID